MWGQGIENVDKRNFNSSFYVQRKSQFKQCFAPLQSTQIAIETEDCINWDAGK